MGSSISSAMSESMEKNQEAMIANQRRMMLQQREMQMAMQVARARDLLMWQGTFASCFAIGSIVGFMKKRDPSMLMPILPMAFVVGYQYDMVYHTKMQRMRAFADQLLREENERGLENRFLPPDHNLMVTPQEYDAWIVVPHRFGAAPDDYLVNEVSSTS